MAKGKWGRGPYQSRETNRGQGGYVELNRDLADFLKSLVPTEGYSISRPITHAHHQSFILPISRLQMTASLVLVMSREIVCLGTCPEKGEGKMMLSPGQRCWPPG